MDQLLRAGQPLLLYKLTQGYVKIFTNLNPKEVLPNSIVDESELSSVFLLIPGEKFSTGKIGKEELINRLVINQKLDSIMIPESILEYSYIFTESNLSTYWDRYEENLRKNLNEDVPTYMVVIPQKYNREVFDKILAMIETKEFEEGYSE